MSANSLKAIFGDSLQSIGDKELYANLSTVPDGARKDIQLPPLWTIIFKLNSKGLVDEYYIRKTTEK